MNGIIGTNTYTVGIMFHMYDLCVCVKYYILLYTV